MHRKLIIISFIIILLLPFVISNEQTYFPCGGDEQTLFICDFGDEQTNHLISNPAAVGFEKIFAKIVEPADIFKFPYYIYCIILPLLLIILLIYLLSRKNRKKK